MDIAEVELLHFGIRLVREIRLSPLVIESDLFWVTQFILGIYHTCRKLFLIILKVQTLIST